MSLPTQTKLEELQGKLYAKAKAEPAFRFYSLYDKIYRSDVLAEALRLSKEKRGAPGIDGQTFEQVEKYGEERWLEELQRELQTRTYQPQAVRRVLIPKPGGGERPLGIPTLKDRVAQTAAKLILQPIFEADFSDAAHGYRPGRGGYKPVQLVHQELAQGRTEVVDADISKYFDTIPHAELMKCLARRIADMAVLHLIKMWLKVPVQEKDEQGRPRLTGGKSSKQGTPQGGVISPLLANIYINRLLKAFARSDLMERCGARIVNYADDFVVLCRPGSAAMALAQIRQWLVGMKLTAVVRRVVRARPCRVPGRCCALARAASQLCVGAGAAGDGRLLASPRTKLEPPRRQGPRRELEAPSARRHASPRPGGAARCRPWRARTDRSRGCRRITSGRHRKRRTRRRHEASAGLPQAPRVRATSHRVLRAPHVAVRG